MGDVDRGSFEFVFVVFVCFDGCFEFCWLLCLVWC